MAKPTEDQIRTRAHELWEQAGKPEEQHDEFWHLAEKDLQDSLRDSPGDSPGDEQSTIRSD